MASQSLLLLRTNEGRRKMYGLKETEELGVKKEDELVRAEEEDPE